MKFTDASKVSATINAAREVEYIRSENRSKINDLFNGVPPLTGDQAKKLGIQINTNWGEGPVLAQHGRRQYANAFLQPSNFFKIRLPTAPQEKQKEFELTLTQLINRPLKNSLEYYELFRYRFASLLAHGIGPQIWLSSDDWLAEYVAVEDLRVPTDTHTSMKNLVWFAVRKAYTPGELAEKAYAKEYGRKGVTGWNRKTVSAILDTFKDRDYTVADYTWQNNPEKLAELWKQNGGFFTSDAAPSIHLWHFYFLEDEQKNKGWKLRIVPDMDSGCPGPQPDDFIYTSADKNVAEELSHLLHIQFGDLNNKAPFLYHSVRSLGFLLVEPCYWMNMFRCRLLQHGMEALNPWLRVNDPSGKARAQKVAFFNNCIVPDGVSIVPNTERHQIDANLIHGIMANLRQLMQEASSAYTQDIDSGTSKEKTATEIIAQTSMVNAMMSSLLNTAFHYERFAYMEIARRFCRKNSSNEDVKQFQRKAIQEGVPRQFLNPDLWDIEPEVPLGAGNPTMEMAQAQMLMQVRNLHPPSAQNEILNLYDMAVTRDARLANRLAPTSGIKPITDAQQYAQFVFPVLMEGIPALPRPELNPIEQIETLLGMMAGVIARIESTDNVGEPSDLAGLTACAQFIQTLMQQLAQDDNEKPRVTEYGKALGKLMNSVKGFQQRQSQQNGSPQMPPEALAKIVSAQVTAEVQARIKEAQAAQKMEHKQQGFEAEQARKNAATLSDIQRQTTLDVATIKPPKAIHEPG